MSAEEARSWADDMRRWAREFTERMRSERDESNSERIRERKIILADAAAAQSHVVTDHVEVIRREDGHAAFHSLPSTAMMPPPGPGTTTPLGSRDFDGVRADGKKTTWTIPAGRIGNRLPIEIVSER
jgi:hypothetical protein